MSGVEETARTPFSVNATMVRSMVANQDPNSPITLRTRKFLTNRLLQRKQMVLDVIHPARPNVSKAELCDKLSEMYKTPAEQVAVFGMRTQYGGGRSTGFALIYDTKESLKFEPKYRLVRKGIEPKVEKASRKLRKERKKCVHANIQPCQEGPWYQEVEERRQEEVKHSYLSTWWPCCTSLSAYCSFYVHIPLGIEKLVLCIPSVSMRAYPKDPRVPYSSTRTRSSCLQGHPAQTLGSLCRLQFLQVRLAQRISHRQQSA